MNEDDVKRYLGLKIKQYRNKKKLTQELFSEKIGITQRQVSLIELGKSFPTPKTLLNMCKVLNCTMEEVFAFDTPEETKQIKKRLNGIIDNLSSSKVKILYMIAKNL